MTNDIVAAASQDDVSRSKEYRTPQLRELGALSELTLSGSAGNKENTGQDNQTIRRPNT